MPLKGFNQLVESRNTVSLLISLSLLILTVLIGIWLALTSGVETEVEVDPASGAISIEGPESAFTGTVRGIYRKAPVTISGLPQADVINDDVRARRAVCSIRNDEMTDWSNAAEILRVHLHNEQMDTMCAVFDEQ